MHICCHGPGGWWHLLKLQRKNRKRRQSEILQLLAAFRNWKMCGFVGALASQKDSSPRYKANSLIPSTHIDGFMLISYVDLGSWRIWKQWLCKLVENMGLIRHVIGVLHQQILQTNEACLNFRKNVCYFFEDSQTWTCDLRPDKPNVWPQERHWPCSKSCATRILRESKKGKTWRWPKLKSKIWLVFREASKFAKTVKTLQTKIRQHYDKHFDKTIRKTLGNKRKL